MRKVLFLMTLLSIFPGVQTPCQTTPPDSIRMFYTGGARLNNTTLFGVAGVTVRWSSTIYQFVGFDLGGKEDAKQTTVLVRFKHWKHDALFLFTGPSVESILPDPAAINTVDYLCAASGILWAHEWSPTICSWFGISYLSNQDMRHPVKIGLGITVPMILRE